MGKLTLLHKNKKRIHNLKKTIITRTRLMGDIKIQRAYYNEMNEKGGYVPFDKTFSISKEKFSYAVQEAMNLFAIEDSYSVSCSKKLSNCFCLKYLEVQSEEVIGVSSYINSLSHNRI
ncbi:MAG: hypothetical protein ACUVWN_12345 [bacterium]